MYLTHNWRLLALRGILALAFGVLMLLWLELAWLFIVASFAAFAFVDGALSIAAAVNGHTDGRRWVLALQGILGIAAGTLTLFWPEITALALFVIFAACAIAQGILEIAVAIRFRKQLEGEWLLALSGVLSIAFGVALLLLPEAGFLTIALLVAAYSMAFGLMLLVVAIRLRRLARQERGASARMPYA